MDIRLCHLPPHTHARAHARFFCFFFLSETRFSKMKVIHLLYKITAVAERFLRLPEKEASTRVSATPTGRCQHSLRRVVFPANCDLYVSFFFLKHFPFSLLSRWGTGATRKACTRPRSSCTTTCQTLLVWRQPSCTWESTRRPWTAPGKPTAHGHGRR